MPGEAVARRLLGRATATGTIVVPAVPALGPHIVTVCLQTFAALGVTFDAAQRAHLQSVLESELSTAFSASPRSEIVIEYQAPVGATVNYRVSHRWLSLDSAYDAWVETRTPPYFGQHADARVLSVAEELRPPTQCRVLDVGAGTGRNSVALARRGHPVDAFDVSGRLLDILRSTAEQESLDIAALQGDALSMATVTRRDYSLVVVSEVTSDFRSTADLRRLFHMAATCLAPTGRLVVNVFLAKDGFHPDDAARQLGQQTYTSMFTRDELAAAMEGLALELLSDDSVHDFEHEHLPQAAWPPTSWYQNWVRGLDVFDVGPDQSPIDFRWLVFGRTA